MAIDPKRITYTLNYPKGSVTATLGLLEKMGAAFTPKWDATVLGPKPGSNRRRRSYATTQRSAAKGGRNVIIRMRDGTEWQARITGAMLDFETYVLNRLGTVNVFGVYTARGTKYGPEFKDTLL
jgi:hypothetical protein